MIYEGERHVDQARGHLVSCESSENSVKRELKKASKKCNAEEVRQLEIKLAQAQRSKDLAQFEGMLCSSSFYGATYKFDFFGRKMTFKG